MHLNISIGAVGDPPLFPEFKPDSEAEIYAVGILQSGTTKGRVSAGILIEDGLGKKHLIQISGHLLIALAGAVRAAQRRFGDPED